MSKICLKAFTFITSSYIPYYSAKPKILLLCSVLLMPFETSTRWRYLTHQRFTWSPVVCVFNLISNTCQIILSILPFNLQNLVFHSMADCEGVIGFILLLYLMRRVGIFVTLQPFASSGRLQQDIIWCTLDELRRLIKFAKFSFCHSHYSCSCTPTIMCRRLGGGGGEGTAICNRS